MELIKLARELLVFILALILIFLITVPPLREYLLVLLGLIYILYLNFVSGEKPRPKSLGMTIISVWQKVCSWEHVKIGFPPISQLVMSNNFSWLPSKNNQKGMALYVDFANSGGLFKAVVFDQMSDWRARNEYSPMITFLNYNFSAMSTYDMRKQLIGETETPFGKNIEDLASRFGIDKSAITTFLLQKKEEDEKKRQEEVEQNEEQ